MFSVSVWELGGIRPHRAIRPTVETLVVNRTLAHTAKQNRLLSFAELTSVNAKYDDIVNIC